MSSRRHAYYLEIATQEAQKSTLSQRHGAVIVLNNKVVATGYNKTELSRKKLLLWYGPKKCNDSGFIHAEYDAIYDLITRTRHTFKNTRIRRKKLDIYIAKSTHYNSKPCKDCLNMLRAFGIARIFYTLVPGQEIVEKTNNMKTEHISSGRK